MNPAPPLKFQIQPEARARLEAVAAFHAFGGNETSVNDLARLVLAQFSKVPADRLFDALAALKPFQSDEPAKPRARA